MRRQVNRNSSSNRQGSSCDQYKSILSSTKKCEIVLENASRMLMESEDLFGKENVTSMSEDIMSLAKANVQIDFTAGYVKRNLYTMDPDDVLTPAENTKRIKNDVMDLSKTDTTNTQFVMKIAQILKMDGNEMEEEDMVEIRRPDKISTFNCPYTAQRIDVPMKNAACPHVVSKQGLTEMLRVGRLGCPAAGCQAKWSKNTATIDVDFQKRMQLFFSRAAAVAAQEAAVAPEATEIHDDGEEDEYTQI